MQYVLCNVFLVTLIGLESLPHLPFVTTPVQNQHKPIMKWSYACVQTTPQIMLLNFSGTLIALLHYLHFFRSTNLTMIKITFDLITLK